MPTCGYCGAAFGKPTDAEEHGLAGHGPEDTDVIYYEGDQEFLDFLLWRRGQ
jgi:hypothetical protein